MILLASLINVLYFCTTKNTIALKYYERKRLIREQQGEDK